MTKKFFVSLALLAGMVTPALAEGTHTIQAWGSNFEVPNEPAPLLAAPVPAAPRANRPAGTHTIEVWGSDFQVTNRPVRWTGARASASVGPNLALYGSDEDDDNAKNPALPSYERGRGQETGGPARLRIPN
jgi:hypothetical protein